MGFRDWGVGFGVYGHSFRASGLWFRPTRCSRALRKIFSKKGTYLKF